MIVLAIFAAGVLVGVGGAALVIKGRAPRALEAAAPRASTPRAPELRALAPRAPEPAPLAAPEVPQIEHAKGRGDADKADAQSSAAAEEPARERTPLPVPSFNAPSCQQVLGHPLATRANTQAASRETRLANHELLLGNVAKAQAAYCTALGWDRSNIDRHVNLARLFLVRRDWTKAAEYGQSALKLDPNSHPALAVVGDAWASLDKTQEARAAWLAAERKTTASPRELRLIVRRNMGLAMRVERLKDFLLAERLYRRVLLLDPEHVGATRGVASCLLKQGSYQAAEAWARRADVLQRVEPARKG